MSYPHLAPLWPLQSIAEGTLELFDHGASHLVGVLDLLFQSALTAPYLVLCR